MNRFSSLQSDLATERRAADPDCEGVDFSESRHGIFTLSRLQITSRAGEAAIGRPIGSYVTLSFSGKSPEKQDEEQAVALLCAELSGMARRLCDCRSVLVVGLGNRALSSDALGARVVDSLVITRHVRLHEPKLFDSLFDCELSALAPGVLGSTGIETLELVRGAVERVRPSLVVAVDSLAARSVDRLACTIQLCDTGIAPGSGVGNSRAALDRDTLGVPVVALGVPTVVNSALMIRDALELGGVSRPDKGLVRLLDKGADFFVSPKDIDLSVGRLAPLIADSINLSFVGC